MKTLIAAAEPDPPHRPISAASPSTSTASRAATYLSLQDSLRPQTAATITWTESVEAWLADW